MNINKVILKTALITLAVIIGVFGIVCLFIGLFSPITFAKLFEDTGSLGTSYYFYEKAYSKSTDINHTYTLVDKAIQFKLDKKVVKYYEQLSSHEQYQEFVEFKNEHNYSNQNNILTNVMMSNEDNRLKTRYVSSLATIDLDKAFKYAIQDLNDIDVNEQNINFVISGLYKYITEDNSKYFDSNDYSVDGVLVADKIKDTFDQLNTVYQAKKSTASKYQLAQYSNKLVDMCQTMILISDIVDHSVITTDYNIDNLKDTLAVLVEEFQSYCR